MEKEVTVVIPIYTVNLNRFERFSLNTCFSTLSKYDIVIIKPNSLDLSPLDSILHDKNFSVESFDDSFFIGRKGYNKLMLSTIFYERFIGSRYILIYQTDVIVFKDDLYKWCSTGYDYIGAPWLPDKRGWLDKKFPYIIDWFLRYNISKITPFFHSMKMKFKVGNGGLSLRKVSTFIQVLQEHNSLAEFYWKHSTKPCYYEDVFWSKMAINIPSYKEAAFFSWESHIPTAEYLTNGELPFGVHAFYKPKQKKYLLKYIDLDSVNEEGEIKNKSPKN